MRMPPLLADFIYSSDCKLICEKSLTLPAYILFAFFSQLGLFTRNYTQTVKRAADNKRRYASDRGIAPVCWGVSKGGSAPFGTRLCEAKCSVLYALPALP